MPAALLLLLALARAAAPSASAVAAAVVRGAPVGARGDAVDADARGGELDAPSAATHYSTPTATPATLGDNTAPWLNFSSTASLAATASTVRGPADLVFPPDALPVVNDFGFRIASITVTATVVANNVPRCNLLFFCWGAAFAPCPSAPSCSLSYDFTRDDPAGAVPGEAQALIASLRYGNATAIPAAGAAVSLAFTLVNNHGFRSGAAPDAAGRASSTTPLGGCPSDFVVTPLANATKTLQPDLRQLPSPSPSRTPSQSPMPSVTPAGYFVAPSAAGVLWTSPPSCTTVRATLSGGGGGGVWSNTDTTGWVGPGGAGAQVTAVFAVPGGTQLLAYVGSGGPVSSPSSRGCGSGGAASAVTIGGVLLAIAAGGGGGCAGGYQLSGCPGGAGGTPTSATTCFNYGGGRPDPASASPSLTPVPPPVLLPPPCASPPSATSNLTIAAGGFTSLPTTTTAVAITEGAPPAPLWPGFAAQWGGSPLALYAVRVRIVAGCTPSDALAVPDGDGDDVLPPSIAVSPLANTACTADLVLAGPSSLGFFVAALRRLTMSTSSSNVARAAARRVLRVDFDALATAFSTVAVAPANDAAVLASPAVAVREGAAPDFFFVIRANCSGGGGALFGLPALCAADRDAPFARVDGAVDAYAGARAGGATALSTAVASNYTVAFSKLAHVSAAGGAAPCALAAAVAPVGAPLWDCSEARPAGGAPAAPVACWAQRFRLMVGVNNVRGDGSSAAQPLIAAGAPPAGAALVAHAAYCDASSAADAEGALFPVGANFTATVTLTDALLDALAPPITWTESVAISLVPAAAAVLTWPDTATLRNVDASLVVAPPNASAALVIDDVTGAAAAADATMLACATGPYSGSGIVTALTVSALEGPAALPNATPAGALFVADGFGAAMPLLLKDAPACAAAFAAAGRTPEAGMAKGSSVAAWAWVQALRVRAAPPGLLQTVPARALTLRVSVPGSAAAPLSMPLRLARANAPVAWAPAAQMVALAERAPPGTAAAPMINVTDADGSQDIVFRVAAASVSSCGGRSPRAGGNDFAALFSVAAVPRVVPAVDFATGASTNVSAARAARLVVAADALDLGEAARVCGAPIATVANCTFVVVVEARDSGLFNASHSLLPPAPPTTAIASITVVVTRATSPSITSIDAPPGGLSAGGGDAVTLRGGALLAGLDGNISAALVGAGGATFPLLNCCAASRLTALRCVTTPGYGAALTLRAWTAGGRPVDTTGATASYAAPALIAVAADSSAAVATATAVVHATSAALLLALASITNSSAARAAAIAGVPLDSVPEAAATFAALVGGVPPRALLDGLGRCARARATLALDNGTVIAAGECAREPAAAATPILSGAPLSSPAAAAAAAWFTCPLPPLPAGALRRVAVAVDFANAGGCASSPQAIAASLSTVTSDSVMLPSPFSAAAAALAVPFAVTRQPPTITLVTQPAPGGRFVITGTNLGAPALADDGDVVEYAAVDAGGAPVPACASPPAAAADVALAGVSCATHAARNCTYAAAHTSISCDLSASGWGRGFRVRVIVRALASNWSAQTIAHAPPVLLDARVVSLAGFLGDADNATANAAVLEGGAGGLLLLRGTGLWPPHALFITVGGVRVFPIDARPLPGGGRAPPAACGTSCYGGAAYSWQAAPRAAAALSAGAAAGQPPRALRRAQSVLPTGTGLTFPLGTLAGTAWLAPRGGCTVTATVTGGSGGGNRAGAAGGGGASFSVTFWSDGVTPFYAQSAGGGATASGGGAAALYFNSLSSVIAVAGGGGGGGTSRGGNAGPPGSSASSGTNFATGTSNGGGGGSQVAPGSLGGGSQTGTPALAGAGRNGGRGGFSASTPVFAGGLGFGVGGSAVNQGGYAGGGGGGGWFGGGGGSQGVASSSSGGGGGSSYVNTALGATYGTVTYGVGASSAGTTAAAGYVTLTSCVPPTRAILPTGTSLAVPLSTQRPYSAPPGGCTVTLTLQGAAGGNAGVSPTTYGGNGYNFDITFYDDGVAPFFVGFGPGGAGTGAGGAYVSAGGGSATGVYRGVLGYPSQLIAVAGGGGGAAWLAAAVGGDAGPPGGAGRSGLPAPSGGGGGNQTVPGAYSAAATTYPNSIAGTAGSKNSGGAGCRQTTSTCAYPGGVSLGLGAGGCGWSNEMGLANGGGGGAGFWGGAGGTCGASSNQASGGGGSSYVNPSVVLSATTGSATGRATGLGASGTAGFVTLRSCIAPSPSITSSPSTTPSPSPSIAPSSTRGLTPTRAPSPSLSASRAPSPSPSASALRDVADVSTPESRLSSVLVAAPPGFGTVDVTVAVGSAISTVNVTYRQATISDVKIKAVQNATKTLFVTARGLSPCLLCVPFGNAAALSPTCSAKAPSSNRLAGASSATDSSTVMDLKLLPVNASGEGALPQALGSAELASADGCALPSALWTPPPALGGPRMLRLGDASVIFTVAGQRLSMDFVDVLSTAGSDDFAFTTAASKGVIALTFAPTAGAAPAPMLVPQDFDVARLDVKAPELVSVTPNTNWTAAGGTIITLRVDKVGFRGFVALTPLDALEGVASSGNASAWPGGEMLCPFTPDTLVTITDEQGEVSTPRPLRDIEDGECAGNKCGKAPDGSFLFSTGAKIVSVPRSEAPPCFITEWSGAALPIKGLEIVFSAPAFRGTLSVSVISDDGRSKPRPATYAPPALAALSPPAGSTAGGTSITLQGSDFGGAPSLGAMWNAMNPCAVYNALGPTNAPGPCVSDVAPGLVASSVRVAYAAAVDAPPRDCAITAWGDESITCTTPEGMPGTTVDVVLVANTTDPQTAGLPTAAVAFKYGCPAGPVAPDCVLADGVFESTLSGASLNATIPPPGVPDGTRAWVVRGVNFGRVSAETLVAAALKSDLFSAADFAALARAAANASAFACGGGACGAGALAARAVGGAPDPTDGGFWSAALQLTPMPDRGLVRGEGFASTSTAVLLGVAHDSLAFAVPALVNDTGSSPVQPIEGVVMPALVITDRDSRIKYTFSLAAIIKAPPPVLLSVTARARDALDDADPCAALIAPRPAASADGDAFTCIDEARAVFNHSAAPNVTLDASRPCVRATAARGGGFTQLVVKGRNFGSGGAANMAIYVLPSALVARLLPGASAIADAESLKFAADAGAALPCAPIAGSVFVSPTQLECVLTGVLPPGAFDVVVSVAFRVLASSAEGVSPVAVCACGFTPSMSAKVCAALSPPQAAPCCASCPPGASCAGGSDAPRALADFWRTDASEWAANFVNTSTVAVAEFVPCPFPGLCAPDQRCRPGAQGWLCAQCRFDDAAQFMRSGTGACQSCNRASSFAAVYTLLALAATALLAARLVPGMLAEWRASSEAAAAAAGAAGLAPPAPSCGRLRAAAALAVDAATCGPVRRAAARGCFAFGVAVCPRRAPARAPRDPYAPPSVVPLLKIALSFLQTLSALTAYVTASRTRRVVKGDLNLIPGFLASISVVTSFGLKSAEFKCAAPVNFSQKLVAYMAAPVTLVILVPLALVAYAALDRLAVVACARARGRAPPPPPPPPANGPFFYAIAALFTVLPTVVGVLAKAQFCAPLAEGGYLYDDPDVSCADASFRDRLQTDARWLGWLLILLPAGAFGVFLLERRGKDAPAFSDTFLAFMKRGYRDAPRVAAGWEGVSMFRKLLLTGLGAGVFPAFADARSQVSVSLLLLCVTLVAHIRVRPWAAPALNSLDTLSYIADITVAISVGARVQTFLSPGYAAPVAEQLAFDAFALLTCVPFAALWLFTAADVAAGGWHTEAAMDLAEDWDAAIRRWGATAARSFRACMASSRRLLVPRAPGAPPLPPAAPRVALAETAQTENPMRAAGAGAGDDPRAPTP